MAERYSCVDTLPRRLSSLLFQMYTFDHSLCGVFGVATANIFLSVNQMMIKSLYESSATVLLATESFMMVRFT